MPDAIVEVPVEGGTLRVARWEGAGPVVVAAHGLTASYVSWYHVADRLDGAVTLLAPDLRGRGRSADVGPPYGLRVHAADLVAVLDHAGADRAVIVGHSMGAFVATAMATLFPDRVESLLLIDGGAKVADPPADGDIDALLERILGPSIQRLQMTFPSAEAYREFWRAHPAFAQTGGGPIVDAYADHDLVGEEPNLRSCVSVDAVRADATGTVVDDQILDAMEHLRCPAHWLRAERGVLNDLPGLYPDAFAQDFLARVPGITSEVVPDVNHFTLVMSDAGAQVVAERIRKAAAA